MSLRVAGNIAPAIVVTFAKGMTLGCMFRLDWHDFAEQRGSRVKCQQTLGYDTRNFVPSDCALSPIFP
jgi:hypothetical protein